MSREKQIEEMAEVTIKHCEIDNQCGSCHWSTCNECLSEVLYNAGYRKQEWISVEERLPSDEEQRDEYGELVPFLVCEKDTTYPYRAFYDGKEWGDGLMRIRGITHWMPLPPPPEKEKSNG